jgi:hypothetical protein
MLKKVQVRQAQLLPLAGVARVWQDSGCVQHTLCVQSFPCPTAKRALQGEAIGEGDLALGVGRERQECLCIQLAFCLTTPGFMPVHWQGGSAGLKTDDTSHCPFPLPHPRASGSSAP